MGHGGITLVGGCAGDCGAQLGARVAVWDDDIAQQIERLTELLNGLLRIAVKQGDLAKRMCERGKRLRLAARAGDSCQRIGAGAGVSISVCCREEAHHPAQHRYRVVAVLDLLPPAEDEATTLRDSVIRAVELVEKRQPPSGK